MVPKIIYLVRRWSSYKLCDTRRSQKLQKHYVNSLAFDTHDRMLRHGSFLNLRQRDIKPDTVSPRRSASDIFGSVPFEFSPEEETN